MSDIATTLSCDPSGLTAGMSQARDQVNQTTTIIYNQRSAWAELGAAGIHAAASLAGTGAHIFVELKKLEHEARQFVITTALAGAAFLGIVAPATASKLAIAGGAAAVIYHHQWLLRLVGFAVPGWGQVAAAVSLAITAYKLVRFAVDETVTAFRGSVDGTGDLIPQYNRLAKSSSDFMKSLTGMKEAIVTPFVDGADVLKTFVESYSPLPTIAGVSATAIEGTTKVIEWHSTQVRLATGFMTGLMLSIANTGSASMDSIDAHMKHGNALQQMAAETERVIALQTQQQLSYKTLNAIQTQATSNAQAAAEVAKISGMFTVEALDAETAALRARSTAAINAGTADEAWQKQMAALFGALERQKQGLIDGTIVDKEAEEAKRALAKATADAAKAAADAAAKELQLQLTGAQKIESMKDQIDLLSGAATNADIAMREMWRAGQSNEVIEEVGKLTEELDRLKEEAKPEKKAKAEKNVNENNKATFAGSSAAAEIMLRGIGGGNKMESLAQKQIAVTERVARGVESIEMPNLIAGDFGTGGNVA